MSYDEQQAMSYTLHSGDGRVHATVHRGSPAYVYIIHDGLTEGEIDAALLELAAQMPAPCWVIVLPTFGSVGNDLGSLRDEPKFCCSCACGDLR